MVLRYSNSGKEGVFGRLEPNRFLDHLRSTQHQLVRRTGSSGCRRCLELVQEPVVVCWEGGRDRRVDGREVNPEFGVGRRDQGTIQTEPIGIFDVLTQDLVDESIVGSIK